MWEPPEFAPETLIAENESNEELLLSAVEQNNSLEGQNTLQMVNYFQNGRYSKLKEYLTDMSLFDGNSELNSKYLESKIAEFNELISSLEVENEKLEQQIKEKRCELFQYIKAIHDDSAVSPSLPPDLNNLNSSHCSQEVAEKLREFASKYNFESDRSDEIAKAVARKTIHPSVFDSFVEKAKVLGNIRAETTNYKIVSEKLNNLTSKIDADMANDFSEYHFQPSHYSIITNALNEATRSIQDAMNVQGFHISNTSENQFDANWAPILQIENDVKNLRKLLMDTIKDNNQIPMPLTMIDTGKEKETLIQAKTAVDQSIQTMKQYLDSLIQKGIIDWHIKTEEEAYQIAEQNKQIQST